MCQSVQDGGQRLKWPGVPDHYPRDIVNPTGLKNDASSMTWYLQSIPGGHCKTGRTEKGHKYYAFCWTQKTTNMHQGSLYFYRVTVKCSYSNKVHWTSIVPNCSSNSSLLAHSSDLAWSEVSHNLLAHWIEKILILLTIWKIEWHWKHQCVNYVTNGCLTICEGTTELSCILAF